MHTHAAVSLEPVRLAILGASGYSGAELFRLLAGHPGAEVTVATAGERAGQLLGEVYPHLAPYADLRLEAVDTHVDGRADLAFLALPHGRSSTLAPKLLEGGIRVIDLAGDFRLPAEAYPSWYGFEHRAPEWIDEAVYGLPELFAKDIAGADL